MDELVSAHGLRCAFGNRTIFRDIIKQRNLTQAKAAELLGTCQYELHFPVPHCHANQHLSENAFNTNAFAKMNQLRTVARQLALEFFHAAKSQVVWIALPLQYRYFIAQVFELLEDQQPNHQTNRLVECTYAIGVMNA